jgi:response regulator RpfG family c-di-GMP phosphodiesterase
MIYKILIVDDEPANLRMLERLLNLENDVLTASSGTEALELLSRHDISLIISDQRMPGLTGIEFLKQAAQMRPQTVRIILTGYTDVNDLVEAINSGVVYKYITKPWVNSDLRQTVKRAIEHFEVTKDQHLMTLENTRLASRLKATVDGFVTAVGTMAARDVPEVMEHCRRTANYAEFIAQQIGLSSTQIRELVSASLLHEVVNVEVPMNGIVTDEDRCRGLREAFEQRLQLLSTVPDIEEAATLIRYQHEKFDGTGFFDGLSGDKIPLGSRILAVANAYDEIAAGLRPGFSNTNEAAAEWLRTYAGSSYDPLVVEAFLGAEPAQFNGNSDLTKFIYQVERPMLSAA